MAYFHPNLLYLWFTNEYERLRTVTNEYIRLHAVE